MISEEYNLQLRPGGPVLVVHCSQYDVVNNMYTFYLLYGNRAFNDNGYTAKVSGTKPDKKGFEYPATFHYYSGSGSDDPPYTYVTVNLKEQMSCVPGPVRCKLELAKTGGDFFSAPFILMVDAAGLADDVDISETVLPDYIDAAERAAREAASYVNSSEAWARGTRDGVPVTQGDETYQNNSKYYSEQSAAQVSLAEAQAQAAAGSANTANTNAQNAEAWAVGQRGGVDVPTTDQTYRNNSKWYAGKASDSANSAAGSAAAAAASVAQGTQVEFWVQGGILYVRQTIQGVQQPAVALGSVTSPNTDYKFATVADMNTAIGNGDVLNNGMCYVAEDTGSIWRNENGTAVRYGINQTVGNRASGSTVGANSFAQGVNVVASGNRSFASGYKTEATANCAHAEGLEGKATAEAAHVEGGARIASGRFSHAEGNYCEATASTAHAEGSSSVASGMSSHAEGGSATASGSYAHAEGEGTTASEEAAHAEGRSTLASGKYQHAGGIANVEKTADGNFLVIGNGTISGGTTTRSNCFRVYTTAVYGNGAYNSSGADYAEYFEWLDANSNREDRAGRFVTLDGDKIRLASADDDFILGIVSGNASVIGDSHDDQWAHMYERDVFGRYIFEDVEIPAEIEEIDGQTIEIIPAHWEHRLKLNPEYDGTQAYMPRSERAEWDAVGMVGKLVALDDGTCAVNEYCTPSNEGIATAAEGRTRYRVMKRLDENHIQVVII